MALLLPAFPEPQSSFDYLFPPFIFIRSALACSVPLAYKVTTSEDTGRLLVMSGLMIINIMNVKATRFD